MLNSIKVRPVKIIFFIALQAMFVRAIGNNPTEAEWIRNMSDATSSQAAISFNAVKKIKELDSAQKVQLDQLMDNIISHHSSSRIKARAYYFKGWIFSFPPFSSSGKSMEYMKLAVDKSLETDDKMLMADCYSAYGQQCLYNRHFEKSMVYYLHAAEMKESLGAQLFPNYGEFLNDFAQALYKVQEFQKCIHYSQLALLYINNTLSERARTNLLNTLGLCYEKMENYDSSIFWFEKSLSDARQRKDSAWIGIISGNLGVIYYKVKNYPRAISLLSTDYQLSIVNHEYGSAANSLYSLARVFLKNGQTDSAIFYSNKGHALARNTGVFKTDPYSYRHVCLTLSELYKVRNMTDSAYFFQNRYMEISDSLNRYASKGRLDVVQLKVEVESLGNNISNLQLARRKNEVQNTYIIIGMICLVVAAAIYYRWTQRTLKMQRMILHNEKQLADIKIRNNAQMLEQFTQNILEKNRMIEALQAQLSLQSSEVSNELMHLTILTDEDWARFKTLFEKVYPSFFSKLHKASPEISFAELRLAALMRLNLGVKHIASMLGISTDAVRKTRSRLRQRLQLPMDENLESFIQEM